METRSWAISRAKSRRERQKAMIAAYANLRLRFERKNTVRKEDSDMVKREE